MENLAPSAASRANWRWGHCVVSEQRPVGDSSIPLAGGEGARAGIGPAARAWPRAASEPRGLGRQRLSERAPRGGHYFQQCKSMLSSEGGGPGALRRLLAM